MHPSAPDIELRSLPYPYRAMLAICSDLDETPDRHVYREIMRFLNTTDETAMGPGVGLEVGNTIYFDMHPGQFAYWTTDDAGRDMVRTLIRSGHIDCLHSYGDLATTRTHAGRALDDLDRHGCRLEVWIDHAIAPTNFGPDIMQGHGDELGHSAYHADLTLAHGIRYVWRGRVTSVVGQEVAPRLGGIWTARHPVASGRTVAKELVKHVLARRGHPKYAMHAPNRLLQPATLRDGAPVYEFLRTNPHWGGVSSCDTGRGIGSVLTAGMLDRLAERGGVSLLYTHLGKCDTPERPFGPAAVAGFRRLAERVRDGRLLVTTTRRALRYCTVRGQVTWSCRRESDATVIEIRTKQSGNPLDRVFPGDLAGLTFYTPEKSRARVEVDGSEVQTRANPPDETGRPSLMIDWPRLAFPPI